MNFSARKGLVLAVLGWLPTAGPALAAELKPVPLVRCASDGQMGPQPAPRRARATPRLPRADAARLAYYASANLGVLAPRGWRCFGLYGSNGSVLVVTPERHGSELIDGMHLKGPAVEFYGRDGETSGRFEVADAAAGLFPVAKAFVQRVAAEGIEPIRPWRISASDRITYRSATRVEFVTAPGGRGLGTVGGLEPSRDPIRGAVLLEPEDGMSLMTIRVRLPPADARLASVIVQQVEKQIGEPSGTGLDEP